MTAELAIAIIEGVGKLVGAWVGRAKFADGTVLTKEHIDAAFARADKPWQSVEETAQAELGKLDSKK